MTADEPATRECPICRTERPAVRFCGHCGADVEAPVNRWNLLLRPKVYANAHREPVWTPRVSSALFPRLAGPARAPFRLAMALVIVAVLVLTAADIYGPLGVISVIGCPLIFLIYVWESDVFHDVPARILVTAMLLGIALGVAYWLAVGKLIAGSYGVSTGSGLLLVGEVLNSGFLLTAGGSVLMLVPALVTRWYRLSGRESLDGFVVGAFGALWFSTAATTTILAPQYVEGLREKLDTWRTLEDSITYGIVNAIVTTAAGGLVGLALWFQPAPDSGRDPRRARAALLLSAILGVGCYLGVWAIDSFDLPKLIDLGSKIALAVLAIVTVRFGVQIALLHEKPEVTTGDPILCVHCLRVVPDLPFCVACGAASRAASASSRRLRRQSPPVRQTVD